MIYFPITSTYLAPLFAFFAPAFLGPPAPAAPNKSSILLELLKLVPGLLPTGGPPTDIPLAVLVFDTDRSIATGPGGAGTPSPPAGKLVSDDDASGGGGADSGPRLAARGGPVGGALARPGSGPGPPPIGGPGLAETDRGAPPPAAARGGGGAGFLAASSGPAFLLTHRLSSGS